MKRIRIGKDIEIHWPILTNGEPVALEGRDLKLFVHLPSHMDIPVDFTTEGNTAIFIISGAMQKSIGVYRLTMWENLQKRGQTAVDYCKAFELVPTTILEGGEDESNLRSETVDLEASSLVVGLPGESAYEAFKKYNPNSELTEEEYAEAPINAANAANEAAKAANDAAGKIGDIDKLLAAKVDKEEGKGLSTNDYTDQEKEKLAGLSNYDDTQVWEELGGKASKQELTEAAAGALDSAKSYADTEVKKAQEEIEVAIELFVVPAIANKITEGDAEAFKQGKAYTDTKTAELWNNVSDVFDATSEELNSNISGGDTQTLTEAKNYTDKAISEIPTPDVSGQIERHNTSPTAHPDIRELLNTCVGLPEFNDKTYELTFTTKGGAKSIIDLPIEKMELHYNEDTQSIEFANADGSISSIPVSDFVKVYVGSIGSEIQVTVEGSEIRATLLNNTVSWDKLTLALQEMIQGKADRTELPTKLSQLQNDPNFVTSGTLEEEFVRQVGNIRISALESLVDGAGSKEIAANAASKYAFAEWPLLKEVCGGDELTLSVGAIEVLKGSADVFTVSLLDPDYKTHLAPQSELTRESLTHVFKVTEGVAKQPATVLIYAGKIGSTAGNTVRVSDVVLSWSPSPPQQQQQMDVLAHSDCTLEERVTHLERLLVGVLSGKVLIPELQVKKLGVWGDNNLVVTGEGAPAKAPDRAGQFYVDTKNNAVYHSVGNGAVSDWKNA